ncbi:tRNA (adenosine(37)-N6)-threonylcarbamoyltransferase complex transferase subunit TsaD [Candidatus Microgenomates bacterium]|nr:tRNA (adenosine(37)-N6)-threonylcarbamoyltransferase complex transferase subunit TsaD [Candidatus Microgenomates bacterium]
MRILGIETSCDETAAAVIEAEKGDQKVKLLSNVITSSLALHAKTGGIIPEVAAREQVKYIIPVIQQTLRESNLYPLSSKINLQPSTIYRPDIDAIAVTVGPGLIGSLLVGVETAKTLAYVWNKPIIPINHLVGHIYANWVNQLSVLHSRSSDSGSSVIGQSGSETDQQTTDQPISENRQQKTDNITPEFPALALIVSGGHTDLVLMKNHGKLTWLGGTRDDAAGEAFDKIGRLLGFSYPAGPMIAKIAEQGNPKAFNFPRPIIDSNDFDFSFSGLKTAVFKEVGSQKLEVRSKQLLADLSASVQQAIVDVLVAKTIKAAQKYKVKSILLGGGVAANQKLREQLKLEIVRQRRIRLWRRNWKLEIPFFVPEKWLCTDNAAMIASAAFFNLARKGASSAYKSTSWSLITANPELYFK